MSGRFALLILLLVGGAARAAKVTYVSPNEGGTNGATQLTIHGEDFPIDLSLTPGDFMKEVFLIDDFMEYPCDVHQAESDETQIVCYTRPMVSGRYYVRLRVHDEWLDTSQYCSGRPNHRTCSLYAWDWRTPLITTITWHTGEPMSLLTMHGRIHTTLISSAVDEAENGETAMITRVRMTSGICDVYNGTDNPYGVELYNENTRWGFITCKVDSLFVGNQNVSFLVDGPFGRSLEDTKTKKVSADDRIYMLQTYAVVEDVSPKVGSTLGGTTMTITGRFFDNLTGAGAKVLVGGAECAIQTVTDTEIKCTTPAQAAARPLYGGGRGFMVEVFADQTDIDADLTTTSPAWSFHQDSSHIGNIDMNNFLTRTRGLFVPSTTGNYKFLIKADDEAKVYVNKGGNDPAGKELVVTSTSSSTYTWSDSVPLNAGTEYYLEVRHVDYSGSSHVHLAVYGDTTNYTPAETSWAISDEQTIAIFSNVVKEQQTVAFEQWNTQTHVNSVWNLALQCTQDPCTDVFQLSLFGTSTVPMAYGTEASAVQTALSELLALNGDGVSVTGDATAYEITFSSTRGSVPVVAQSSGDSLTVTATETTAGVAALDTVTFEVNGLVSESVPYNANEAAVANAVLGLFGRKCPSEIEAGLADSRLLYENMEANSATIAGRTSESSFCGLFSAKNPAVLYQNEDGYMTAQFASLCFAYIGDISDLLRISYTFSDLDTFITESKELAYFYNVGFTDTDVWKHVCVDINSLLTQEHSNGGEFRVQQLRLTAGGDADLDLFVDNILISSAAKYTGPQLDAHVSRIRPSAVPSIQLSGVTVAKTEGTGDVNVTYQITFDPIDCGNDFPLLGVAFGTKQSVSSEEDTYDWGSDAKVRVTRTATASPPVTGTFDISFASGDHGSVAGILADVSEENLATQIEGMNRISDVDVERGGTCYGYWWKVTFKSPGGKFPMLTPNGGQLAGNNPSINVTQGSEGGLLMEPVYGDFTQTGHDSPQVQVFVNGVPSHCAGGFDTDGETSCDFQWSADVTPSVTQVAPLSGPAGTEITITGSGFDGTSNIVRVGGELCDVSSNSETSITCILGESPGGAQTVTVQATGKGSASIPADFSTFTVTSNVASIAPTSGSTAGCTTVTISGAGFDATSTVSLGSASCSVTSYQYDSITCVTSAAAAASVDVTVTTAGTDATSSVTYEYSESGLASVSGVTPTTVTVDGGTEVTITGTNFGSAQGTVSFGDNVIEIVSWNDTQVVATSPPLTPGAYDVKVTLNGVGCALGTNQITYDLSVTAISPTSGSLAGGTEVTLGGSGFKAGMKIMFGDVACDITGDVTPTSVTCVMQAASTTYRIDNTGSHPTYGVGYGWNPSNLEVAVGDRVVYSWTVHDQIEGVAIGVYTIEDTISKNPDDNGFKVNPSTSGSFSYDFNVPGDYNFGSGCVGDANTCDIFMRGTVTVTDAATRSGHLKVVFGEAGHEFEERSFTFDTSETPVITMIEPQSGTIDQQITLTGSGLTAGSLVTIGGKSCQVSSSSSTQLQCTVPVSEELAVGVYHQVRVQVPNVGYARMDIRKANNRYYVLLPQLTAVSPVTGSLSGGTRLTVSGSGFSFANDALTIAITTSNGEVACQVDASASTYSSIVCDTAAVSGAVSGSLAVTQNGVSANCSGTCAFEFASAATPQVTSRDTAVSDDLSTTDITFHGSGFGSDQDSVLVQVGPETCVVSSATDSQIDCALGRYPVGSNDITVKIVGKGYADFTSAGDKQITNPQRVDSISPSAGSLHGGTAITITGNGFVSGSTSVTIGDLACNVTQTDYTTVTCTSAASAAGSLDLVVVSNGVTYTAQSYEYSESATPTITSITLNEASPARRRRSVDPVGSCSGDTVTTGGSFGVITTSDVVILVAGLSCTVCEASATAITFARCFTEGGTHTLTAQLPAGFTAESTLDNPFEIQSILPTSGSYGGMQDVTVTGVGFSGNSIVKICQEECTVKQFEADSIVCSTPAANSGTSTCSVTVTNGGSEATGNVQYTYDSSLTASVASVTPSRGGTAGGTEITITGSGFMPIADQEPTVTIDGSVCNITDFSDTSITCTTNSHEGSIRTKVEVLVSGQGIATQENADFYYIDLWSSTFTWGGGPVPQQEEFVIIQSGQTVLLDQDTSVLKMLLIQGGELIFDEKDIKLHSENILITDGGLLQIGTEEQPFQHNAEIIMYGHQRSPELPIYGAKTLGLRKGTLDLHGRPIQHTWSQLASTANAGASQITLEHDVSDWKVGDLIVIASTGLRHSQKENEIRTITAVSADARTLTLNESLTYEHLGVSSTIEGRLINFRAEVGLLTRNVKFRGTNDHAWHDPIEECEDGFQTGQFDTQTCFQGRFGAEVGSDQFGGSIMIHPKDPDLDEALARIEYVEVSYAGQAFRLGRYPIHWHLPGNVSGMYVRGCGIHQTFNRAVTIHGTHNLLVEHNVIYNIMGGAFFIEDGIETKNVLQYNLAVFVKASSSLLNDDITPAAYWVTNPDNVIRHNHAAGGTHFGFWYRMHQHPDGPSFTTSVCQQKVPLGEFQNNTVHSQGWFGLWVFKSYKPVKDGKCDSDTPEPAIFRSLTTYHCEKGAEWVDGGAIQFHDFVMVSNEHSGMDLKLITGTPWGEGGALVKNALIVGTTEHSRNEHTPRGIVLPYAPGLTIDGVTFVDFTTGVAFGVTDIQGLCTTLCGGFYYRLQGVSFTNTPRKLQWRYEHEGVIEDLDGTFTNVAGGSKVVPKSGLFDPGVCQDADGSVFIGYPSVLCEASTPFHRFALNHILPSSLEANDMILTTRFGTSTVPYAKKRLTHKEGYMAVLPGREKCTMHFKDGQQFTNITYNSKFYDFTPGDYLMMSHNFTQRPDRIAINDEVRYEIENSPKLTDIATWKNLDWNYDQDTKVFTYIVKNDEPAGSRKRRAFEIVDQEFVHPSASPRLYRCEHPDCTFPTGSTVLPGRERPEGYILWSNKTSHCTNTTELREVVIPAGCWVVVDVPNINVDHLTVHGTLEFEESADVSAEYILIIGRLVVGWSEEEYYSGDLSITLRGNHSTPALALPGVALGSKALGCFGGCDLHGRTVAKYWVHLAETANAGATTITLTEGVDWKVDDEIVITTTGYRAVETEKRQIAAISGDGKTLTLSVALDHRHLGETHTAGPNWQYEMRAEVGLLTRNIKIIGEDYDDIETELFGARVLVGRFTSGGSSTTGWARMSNVEFHRTGQEGFTEPYDPRFSLAWLSTGTANPTRPSYVKGCAFHDGYSTAIGTFGANEINITDNVVHRTIHDGIRITGRGHRLERNLVTKVLYRGTYNHRFELNDFKDWHANYELSQAEDLVLINNTASGGERLCFRIDGESCSELGNEGGWSGNTAHGCLHGVHIFLNDGIKPCSMIRNFLIYKAWDYGIYHQTQTSVLVSNTVIVDATVAYLPLIFAPPSLSHNYEDKYAHVHNSLCVGRSESFDPAVDFMDEDTDKNLIVRAQSPSKKAPLTPSGGKTCIMLPLFASGSNGAPFKSYHGNKNYPAIRGSLEIHGLTAHNYKTWTGKRDLVFFTNPANEDAFHPTYIYQIHLSEVDAKSKVYIASPSPGKINPSDCVDMECDAKKKVLIKDINGYFLGSAGAVIPKAEAGWGDQSLGLGDWRIPTAMMTTPDGARIPIDQVRPNKGIIRNDDTCNFNDDWNSYDCNGEGTPDYQMLVMESMDEDTETRRLSPIALRGNGYLDLNNGPQDHGWCLGYTCQKRISTFYMIVSSGTHFDIFCTGYAPRHLRFHFLNVGPTDNVRLGIFYARPERLDVHYQGQLVFAENSVQRPDGVYVKKPPPESNPDQYKPTLSSTKPGANYLDMTERILYVNVVGTDPIDIISLPSVEIHFKVQNEIITVGIEDFFEENLAENLIAFLGVPPEKVRVVNVVRETSARKRRSLGREKRETAVYDVTLEFGDEITNNTNVNTSIQFTAEMLNNMTDMILLHFQQGDLHTIVNASVIGMSSQSAATGNTTDYTQGVVVHKVPTTMSIVIPDTVEELTAFPITPTVTLKDSEGETVTTLGGNWMISVSLDKTGPNADPSAVLGGQTTVPISNGSATFTDLSISHAGQGYKLMFSVSQPSPVMVGQHEATVTVNQRAVQPVFTSGIGSLYNHGDDVLMTLQLRDSSGHLLQNVGHRGLTWRATVALDDAIYGDSAVGGVTTFTFDVTSGLATTTGLKITNTKRYHKYNLLFRVYTEPASYDINVLAEPVQFYSAGTDTIHSTSAATQSARVLIHSRPYTNAQRPTFKVYLYNEFIDVLTTAYIGSLDVADTTDVNTAVTFDVNGENPENVARAIENLKNFVNGTHNLMFNGNPITFALSQCGLEVDTICLITTTTTEASTSESTTTVSTTTTNAPSTDSTWIIIGVAIAVSCLLAAGAIGLACYLKRFPRSKVGPCMGGSQASLGNKSLIDSIPSQSPNATPSSDGLYHRPASKMTPVHV